MLDWKNGPQRTEKYWTELPLIPLLVVVNGTSTDTPCYSSTSGGTHPCLLANWLGWPIDIDAWPQRRISLEVLFCPSRSCTEKTIFPFPFTLHMIWSWWQFSFRFWTKLNSIWFRKSKGKQSPRSYPIQCERNWKYSFLSVHGRLHSTHREIFWKYY